MKDTLTATSAIQLFIQASADATDSRQRAEEKGVIQSWMTNDEGVAIVLALMVRNRYESYFSPRLMTSFLVNYCRGDISEAFVDFFCQLSNQDGSELSAEKLMDKQFDVLLDIREFAIAGKSLGWKKHWGKFKEPFLSQWNSCF